MLATGVDSHIIAVRNILNCNDRVANALKQDHSVYPLIRLKTYFPHRFTCFSCALERAVHAWLITNNLYV